VKSRLHAFNSSFFDSISENTKFDFIVSNPPYIDPDMKNKLEPELAWEPQNALYSDDFGRYAPTKIIDNSMIFLHDNGLLLIEVAEYNIEYFIDYMRKYSLIYSVIKII
jgi:release factor glutamine methyltransferase